MECYENVCMVVVVVVWGEMEDGVGLCCVLVELVFGMCTVVLVLIKVEGWLWGVMNVGIVGDALLLLEIEFCFG